MGLQFFIMGAVGRVSIVLAITGAILRGAVPTPNYKIYNVS